MWVVWLAVLAIALGPRVALPPGADGTLPLVWSERGWVLGTEGGLYRHERAGWRLESRHGAVHDLARDAHGASWIATSAGLYRWPADAEAPLEVPVGASVGVRAVAVDPAGDDTVWTAGEAGLFLRRGGGVFERRGDVPSGGVHAVRATANGVWFAQSGVLWRGHVDESFEPRLRALEEGWWELRAAVAVGETTWLVVPRGVWRVTGKDAAPVELGIGELHHALAAEGRLWVASELGLYSLDPGAPVGTPERLLGGPVAWIAHGPDGVVASTPSGVVRVAAFADAMPAPARTSVAAPDVRTVQIAAIRHQDLSPRDTRRWKERARRVGWMPELHASLGFARDRDRDRDTDEVFSTGALRLLGDSSRGRSTDFGLDLDFVWDLGRIYEPGDALAISREHRQRIQLRDQVLEQVNRLYFERLRLLARLEAAPAAERPELVLRAEELQARLDAWTGGLFSRLLDSTLLDKEKK